MATSYISDPAPKLAPALDGKKVVFSRVADEKPEAEKPAEQPKTEAKPKAAEKQ